jgi:antitoxin ParD1/3/4
MPSVQKRTFSLPAEATSYIDSLVSSGAYANENEVVNAGLQALQDRDATIEQWLREDVLPVVAAMEADPSRGIPIEQVFDNIRRHHEHRSKDDER